MKTRIGFISNSSTTSFIVTYLEDNKNKKAIALGLKHINELKKELEKVNGFKFEVVEKLTLLKKTLVIMKFEQDNMMRTGYVDKLMDILTTELGATKIDERNDEF